MKDDNKENDSEIEGMSRRDWGATVLGLGAVAVTGASAGVVANEVLRHTGQAPKVGGEDMESEFFMGGLLVVAKKAISKAMSRVNGKNPLVEYAEFLDAKLNEVGNKEAWKAALVRKLDLLEDDPQYIYEMGGNVDFRKTINELENRIVPKKRAL